MRLWNKFFGKNKKQSGNDIADLPTYWQWVSGDDPIEKFAGIGSIEMVFREHPEAIGSSEHKVSVELLRLVLSERSKTLQTEAMIVLALIKAMDALPDIVKKLNDADPNVREEAKIASNMLRGIA